MDDPKFTLIEHFVELRGRLIYCLISFCITSAISWQFVPQIISFVSRPVGKLVFLHPTEAFITYFKVCMWAGFFLSLPVIIYNVWKYVALGLSDKEKKNIFIFAPASFILFLFGSSFGFFLAIPAAVKFLIDFGASWSTPMITINEYISFVSLLLLGFGATFELPLVLFFLSKLKIVNAELLKRYRRHAVLFIFIAAAIITPTPDIFIQSLMAFPLIILYEASIWLSRFA
ncbi:twin-arginine translocase subunit TatC [Candidatus Saganbacteria bacterium]|nr:twin-arginine translocase subunit TatC [Candidatus Saganbacteria bacterium]